jgi:hypothetical protein
LNDCAAWRKHRLFGATGAPHIFRIESTLMIRLLLSTTAAVFLLAAPVAASAATTTTATKPVVKHTTAKPHTAKVAGKPAKPRDAGQAATDALNDQSLAKAKAGQ